MKDDTTALAPYAKQARPAGGLRATLALLFSLLALAGSAYALLKSQIEDSRTVNSLVREADDMSPLRDRLAALESTHAQLRDDVSQLKIKVTAAAQAKTREEGAPVQVADPEFAAKIKAIEEKITRTDERAQALENALAEQETANIKALAAITGLDAIRQKLRQGAGFAAEMKKIVPLFAGQQALQVLEAAGAQKISSDKALREELRRLAPDLLAKEKMEQANGFFDRILIQLQKLVTIRPKEGARDEGSVIAGRIAALEKALDEGAWDVALTDAAALDTGAAKDFPAWLKKLRARAEAEIAVGALQDSLTAPVPAAPFPSRED